MKTIHDYLKEYGKYTFLEKEFTDVDNVILSLLSYVDFYNIVPMIKEGSITLKEASDKYYKKHDKKEIDKNILAVRESIALLKELSETERYKNLELLNYEYQVTFDMQFGALCIKLPNKTMYISYEGTDNYISGWEEDFVMSYKFPTKAQITAVDYINMVVGLFGPKVYVGGHSKGGNLALIAGMYCKNRVYRKIKHIYNNDGPGLRLKEINSIRYKRASFRYTHIVPKESFVGMILYHKNYYVIDSSKKNFMQHDAMNWLVEDDHLAQAELSEFSKRVEKAILSWLDKYDDEKREEFVKVLFSILKKAEINDLIALKQAKVSNMLKILKEMKNISKENRIVLAKGLKLLYDEWKDQ